MREFDLETMEFVTDGFTVAEAKTRIGWIDDDRVWIGTDFGAGSMSTSGYPLQVRRWHRGTPLEEAELVYEGRPADLSASGWHDDTPASSGTSSTGRSTSGTRSCSSCPRTPPARP